MQSSPSYRTALRSPPRMAAFVLSTRDNERKRPRESVSHEGGFKHGSNFDEPKLEDRISSRIVSSAKTLVLCENSIILSYAIVK